MHKEANKGGLGTKQPGKQAALRGAATWLGALWQCHAMLSIAKIKETITRASPSRLESLYAVRAFLLLRGAAVPVTQLESPPSAAEAAIANRLPLANTE